MKLKDFISISGYGGLFKYIAQARNGIIVESLETGKRMSAPPSAKMSSLEDIAIYTDTEEIPLSKVFDLIYSKFNGGPAPTNKKSSSDELKAFMADVLPEYDRQRVYVSDIKKLVNWYNELHDHDMLIQEEEVEEDQKENKETPAEDTPDGEKEKPEDTKKE